LVLAVFAFACFTSATYSGNYALSFDGNDDIVTVPHSYQDNFLNDFWTIEAWINPTSAQTAWQLNIVGFPQRHPNLNYCGQTNSQCVPGEPVLQLRDSKGNWFAAIGKASLVSPDSWHHIAGTWDNSTLNLYLDGVLDVSLKPYTQGYTEALSCSSSAMYSCDAGLQIGGNYFRMEQGIFSNQYFRGLIDDVRVWKFARTQMEIQNSMNTALTGRETGLLYYFRFDDIGTQVSKSSAFDVYALLGGGRLEAEPHFVYSTAPLSAPPGPPNPTHPPTPAPIIQHGGGGGVVAGALIGVFCLIGGVAFGLFVGFKHGDRLFPRSWGGSGGEKAPLIPQ